ncbi:YfiR/HmsC family protein [Thalassotalea fusca]
MKHTKNTPMRLLICMALYCFSMVISAQQLSEDQIKAAYLYNFIKHVVWPDEAQKDEFTIAIYRDLRLYRLMVPTFSNRQVKNKPIRFISVNSPEEARHADLVFVPSLSTIDLAELAAQLRQTETLLVTDNSVDKHNVMINLVFNQSTSAISFEVNKSNIIFENLTVSPELLLLGGTELDVAQLYRETELAMQRMRQREAGLNKEIAKQQVLLDETSKHLQQLDRNLQRSTKQAALRQTELLRLQEDIDSQKSAFSDKEAQLTRVAQQLDSAKEQLALQQEEVRLKEQEYSDMAKQIAENKLILDQQNKQLGQQRVQISEQGVQITQKNEELAERKELIEQQRYYLRVMAVLISLALFFLVLLVLLFVKNKRTNAQLNNTLRNLKTTQDQLIQSEKMASLGKLTAGVAHEINTPLGIAVTSTSSALESTRAIRQDFEENNLTKSSMRRYFQSMEEAASLNTSSLERVIELLNNFKQVAADQVVGEIRTIDVVSYVNEVMQTLSAEMKRHRVAYQYSGIEKVEVTTMPGALAQVVTNLVTNSLKHGFDGRTSGNISVDIAQHDEHVVIKYQDDGVGMTSEVLQNIFEPFFTTKRNSGGTGLGMNIVYNIVSQKLKGNIKVTSEVDQGSCFTVMLPFKI